MVHHALSRRGLGCLLIWVIALSLTTSLSVVAQEDESEEYTVGVQLVADGLTAPVDLVSANDGTGRLFVVDQTGPIWILSPDGTMMPDPFLDLSGQIVPLMPDYDERGVLGIAFHPDFANNGRAFVYYTAPLRDGAPAGWDHTNVLAEVSVSPDNPNVADLATLKTVLQIDQPQFNHDSGHITFGPDGYLYIPIGDGGGANDVDEGHTPDLGNGQDLTNLHGSILRIDVNGTPGEYTIPPDNPFAAPDDNAADEIYAYGFRNPYHISFDKGGENDLYASDAGQDRYEEVDEVTAGGNYGWNIKEGTHCFNPDDPKAETDSTSCASTGANGEPLIDPIVEYEHEDVGVVVVGGYIYRGSALPDLEGYYIFGDFARMPESEDAPMNPDGTLLWAEESDSGGMWDWGELSVAGMENNRIGAFVRAFGQDDSGELYVLTSQNLAPSGNTGRIWKLVPAESGDVSAAPAETPEATQPMDASPTEAPGDSDEDEEATEAPTEMNETEEASTAESTERPEMTTEPTQTMEETATAEASS